MFTVSASTSATVISRSRDNVSTVSATDIIWPLLCGTSKMSTTAVEFTGDDCESGTISRNARMTKESSSDSSLPSIGSAKTLIFVRKSFSLSVQKK